MNAFVARQPIFDLNYNVIGYELLYRENNENKYNLDTPGNVATSILLLNTYLNFGLETLVGEEKAFFNFGDNLLHNSIVELLDPEKIVIEILEDVVVDSKLLRRLRELKKMNYIFAIDDLVVSDEREDLEQLVDLCDIVKIDFLNNTTSEIKKLADFWKNKNKVLLAEKIEDKSIFKWASDIGFKYFQGYYFAKPEMAKKPQLNDSILQYLYLMKELTNPAPDIKYISKAIEGDPSLTYKLLKMVNANSHVKEKILNIKHAVMMLGLRNFQTWLTLIMVQNMSYFKTHELVKHAMIRMHFLKKIANNSKKYKEYIDELALLGTLSVMDGILNMKMSKVVETIPLNDDLKETLKDQKTKYSLPYQLCLNYEKGNFVAVDHILKDMKYNKEDLAMQYIKSVKWAKKTFASLNQQLHELENQDDKEQA